MKLFVATTELVVFYDYLLGLAMSDWLLSLLMIFHFVDVMTDSVLPIPYFHSCRYQLFFRRGNDVLVLRPFFMSLICKIRGFGNFSRICMVCTLYAYVHNKE